ncbi:hypothetical protein [Nocardiopsis alba]|uniref:hypothetical protein n=1 Tax=Nocardiopsis alba TaxID=53437 RepID=UPI0033A3086E
MIYMVGSALRDDLVAFEGVGFTLWPLWVIWPDSGAGDVYRGRRPPETVRSLPVPVTIDGSSAAPVFPGVVENTETAL